MIRPLAACCFSIVTISCLFAAEPVRVPTVDQALTIDGVPNEAAWQEAAVIEDFRVLGSQDQPVERTTCRLLRDDENLYVAVHCEQKGGEPVHTHAGRNTNAARDDSIEVFLSPNKGSADYTHFVLGAGGAYYEQKVSGRNRDKAWSASWRKKAVVTADGWTAEAAIPLYVVGIGPRRAAPAFNICRNLKTPNKQFITWAPLGKEYHEPGGFRELGGFERLSVRPVCDARIRKAVAQFYRASNGQLGYLVDLAVENSGGKAGRVVLKLRDVPTEGDVGLFEKEITVHPVGQTQVQWGIPVETLGPRCAQVAVAANDEEWIQVAGAKDLRPLSVFLDRNYYTKEKTAVLVCRAIFDKQQSAENRFRYDVAIRDAGGSEVFSVKVEHPDQETHIEVPVGDFEPGVYRVEVILTHEEGRNLASITTDLTRHAPGPSTEVKFDQIRQVILVDDEPFFPFGFMYCDDLADERLMKRLAGAGFNTVVRWGGVGGGRSFDEQIEHVREGLDTAEKHEIRVFEAALAFGPQLRYGMDDLEERFGKTLQGLRKALAVWRAHPAVIGYYGLDEPGKALFPLAENMYAECHEVDPHRLVYSSSWNDWPPEGYDIFDLLGRHGYYMPVNLKTGTLNKLSRRCAVMAELAARFHRPFVATPQCCWREEIRKITPHEMRCCYFLPLIRGAKGLIFFIHRDSTCHPAEWKAVTTIAAQIRQLIPYLLEPSPPQNVTCNIAAAEEGAMLPPGPAGIYTDFKPIVQRSTTVELPVIQTLIKNHPDGGEIIIAANSEEQDREVTFRLSSIGQGTQVQNFFTGERLDVKGDTFHQRMNGYDVRVYRTIHSTRRKPNDVVTMAINAPAVGGERSERPRNNLLSEDESGFEGEAVGARWEVAGGTKARLSGDSPYAGRTCLAVQLSPEHSGSVTIQAIPLKARHRYRLSAWFRSRMTEGAHGANLLCLVPRQFKTPPRLVLKIPQNQAHWEQITRAFSTLEAANARLSITYPCGVGRIDCDSIVIEELGPIAAEGNWILNASFEEASYFGTPDGWKIADWTDDRDKPSRMHRRQVKGDSIHGEYCARSGNWLGRYPRGRYFQFQTNAEIDFASDYVFSVYLKADRVGVPVKIVCEETGYKEGRLHFETEVTVDREWKRYALDIPSAASKQVGKREVSIGLKCGTACCILADAAQLESERTPTEFKADNYRAVDLGPQYSREAVLSKKPADRVPSD